MAHLFPPEPAGPLAELQLENQTLKAENARLAAENTQLRRQLGADTAAPADKAEAAGVSLAAAGPDLSGLQSGDFRAWGRALLDWIVTYREKTCAEATSVGPCLSPSHGCGCRRCVPPPAPLPSRC